MRPLACLFLATLLCAASSAKPDPVQSTTPRIRIVPQVTDGLIQDMEESLDGTRLITHDKGFAPRLWDARRQILLCVLGGHPDPVTVVGFSQDGSRILTLSAKELRVWDAARARLISTTPATGGDFTAAAFSADAARVGVGMTTGSVAIVEVSAPLAPKVLGKHTKAVRCLAFNKPGDRLFSGSDDATGRLWDAVAGAPLWAVSAHKAPIRWASFSADGELLLTTGLDNKACLFAVKDGSAAGTYAHVIGDRGIENVQMGARFAGPGLKNVAVASAEGSVELYSPGAKEPATRLPAHGAAIREMRVSNDGHYIATYASNETLKIFDAFAAKELPFEPEEGLPTAADFSPREGMFWLGYSEGEVRRYDLATGRSVKATYGTAASIGGAELSGETPLLWMRSTDEAGLFGGGRPTQNYLLDPEGSVKPLWMTMNWDQHRFSPSGRYVAIESRGAAYPFLAIDAWSPDPKKIGEESSGLYRTLGNPTVGFDDMIQNSAWSPDSTKIATLHDDGLVAIWDARTGDNLHQWQWPIDKQQGQISWAAWHPNGKWLLTGGHSNNGLLLWDTETGKAVKPMGEFGDLIAQMQFTKDGKKLILLGWSSLSMINVETLETIWSGGKEGDQAWYGHFKLSADESRLLISSNGKTAVLDAATGKSLFDCTNTDSAADMSADGKRVLSIEATQVKLWDVDSGAVLLTLPHAEKAVAAQFASGDTRILTADRVGGAAIWNASGSQPQKLCSVVFLKDGTWLAYDDQGRYDAPDPSSVTGAYFVLEWDKGLEAISMEQLKAQFYEPKLLAKALGIDKEPLRDVPGLEALRLYPELSLKLNADRKAVEVSVSPRDNGGIGKVTVAINGKQVYSKKAAGFFTFPVEDYSAFMLPDNLLPSSEGNKLSVMVTNEKGDLRSPEQTIYVGVPEGLRAPEVKLYALAVGAGDYAGTGGDLLAPPSDAEGMVQAIQQLGERLLPGRVSTRLLTTRDTDPANRPTRQNILAWLSETGKIATSSDIVLVFFAGHGVSNIGDQSGYYFLTSEADPSNVNAATIGTGTISGDDLKQALGAIAANKQVVILDTCHSGAAAKDLVTANRSVSGEYQRAWESLKDATGTWLLAGSASDQLSYESSNVDHGMLTYSLLEAIDRGSAEGLRKTPSGELFLDVERWLGYAAERVESLKSEVGVKGVQRPEFKRSASGASFDVGVMTDAQKGFLALSAPKPIIIVGGFQMDEEDPLRLEAAVGTAMKESKALKPWFDVVKHPAVYRMAGSYTVDGETVKLRLVLQKFDEAQERKTLDTVELTGTKAGLADLAMKARQEIETRVKALEEARAAK